MFKSLFNWRVFVNLIVAIGLFVGLVWLTFRWLEHHTEYGQEIPVPNVMNLSVKDAIKELENQGLSYEVDSFKFNPKYKPLQVLDIFPKPGAKVKGARAIVMKVNPSTWAKVQVPDVIGVYKGLSYRQIEQVGLKVGDTIFEHNVQKDAVIKMIYNGNGLKAGTLLPRFSSVDLVIGSGPMRDIPVPNLVGMTVAQAKTVIDGHHFELGLVEYENEDEKDEDAIVYYQDPRPRELRDQGMQVDIWASHKGLAELDDEIAELNQVYRRVIVDTTRSIIYQEAAPVYRRSTSNEGDVENPTTKPKVNQSSTEQKSADAPTVTEKPIEKEPAPTVVEVE